MIPSLSLFFRTSEEPAALRLRLISTYLVGWELESNCSPKKNKTVNCKTLSLLHLPVYVLHFAHVLLCFNMYHWPEVKTRSWRVNANNDPSYGECNCSSRGTSWVPTVCDKHVDTKCDINFVVNKPNIVTLKWSVFHVGSVPVVLLCHSLLRL